MTAQTKQTLLEELQLEFPSLDSSLIAAFLSERDSEALTKRQLRKLRRILTELATGAEQDEQLINETLSPAGTHVDGSSLSSNAIDRNDEATSSLASPRSTSSTASFSSPIGFLQAAFPGVPPSRLKRVISDVSCDGGGSVDDVDIERVIQLLLAEEYPRHLGEDGNILDDLNNDPPLAPRAERGLVNVKRKKKKAQTVAINDIRQRPHVHKNSSQSYCGSRSTILPNSSDVDIWTSVSSVSAQLAALLPPHPESFFKSFFHSPESKTPATAVRRALAAITNASDDNIPPLDTTVLLNLQDLLRSTSDYSELNADGRERLLSDAHLCLHAVGSQVDNALDLVWLLRGLEADAAAGWKIAPYHQEPFPSQDGPSLGTFDSTQLAPSVAYPALGSGRPPERPPPDSQNDWSVVSSRKRPVSTSRHGVTIFQSDDSYGMSMDPVRLKERCDDLESRLRETSMLAAKAWKGRNSKNTGKQLVLYQVEEVRRLQDELRDATLDVARARVNATKKATTSVTTIDLHYTTAAQAVTLAKEFLKDYGASGACPMQIITGRGKHSVGGKGVLGPAVYNALTKDGWNVSRFPAGLVVHGRRRD